jgi:adenylate kinase family enzyme
MKIAIIGKICSGKTTIADYLVQINPEFKKLSFATKIKEIAIELFNEKNKNRLLLQQIGTKMREINVNVWVEYTINKSKKYDYVVIDDLRYKNEYDLLKINNYKIIKLIISDELQLSRLKTTYPNDWNSHLENLNHESENFIKTIKDVDLIINIDKDNIYSLINNFYLSLLL